ncbi:DUF3102 domain-containing protein [Mesorhizobium sp. LNHC229A00]|uniref:DUF3102 domain-containing protein n=1 Tax=Mesorhizobium sp. LNHC229A00 TaxID=1287240 RepID=UPI0003CF2589|nr:DUF3102 domain-containing protein [Mesorhizobium sp. LNHC229A00]ESY92919.1 hypothetical protein X741_18590 [Mesorhizobium sp. LNHC229A00]
MWKLKVKKIEIEAPSKGDLPLPSSGTLVTATQRIHENIKAIDAHATAIRERAIQIGRDLITVRTYKKHGDFLDYINVEFQMTPRTAQRYMRVAEFTDLNPETIDMELPLSALYALMEANFAPEILEDIRQKGAPKTGVGIKKAIAAKHTTDDVVTMLPVDPAVQKVHDKAVHNAVALLLEHLPESVLAKLTKHCVAAGWQELACVLKEAGHGA